MTRLAPLLATALLLTACDGTATPDAGLDGGASDGGASDAAIDGGATDGGASDAAIDGGASDGGASDGGGSCLDEHVAGERFSRGDGCNFCECRADGTTACTARACRGTTSPCDYDGATRRYGERFPSTDGCNECVCAASGLACTRRPACGATDEGAILLESMTAQCGDDPAFTGAAVLAGLPVDDLVADFAYERDRALYPETRADSRVRVRVVYEGGFVVCRVPMPTQPAIDMEIVLEWISEDGAFDEAFHTYLRRNDFGFVDAWLSFASAPVGGLDGAYDPACLDPRGFSFFAQFDAEGTAHGTVGKVCESDILLDVARFDYAP
ncbi:MAG: hypothetical protein KF729_13690 [Sandaracinaceae bacterium]|nr:hypothetical protein [Sandaracinaceae bacterium]